MELSIDTSTRYALIGLSVQGEIVAELRWRSERNHSVELVPAMQKLMEHAGVGVKQLEAIFLALGPGGFSALRVGMSTAKGLATSMEIPLVSIGTLDIEAYPHRGLGFPVRSMMDAGRDRLYVGIFDGPLGAANLEPEVLTFEELVSSIKGPTIFCGEAVSQVAGALRERLGVQAMPADSRPPSRTAAALAHLATLRWQAGETDDPATLQPLYLRTSQIVEASRTWSSS